MKTRLFALLVLVVAASCSAPKQIFPFGYYDYEAGRKSAQKEQGVASAEVAKEITQVEQPATFTETTAFNKAKNGSSDAAALTKTEKRAYGQEIKKEIKTAWREVKKVNSVKEVRSAKSMDNDLKMAAIFGAIGLGLGLLFGVSEIIGFIGFVAIVVALFFLIRWLLRQ